jgi:hypothetical protein
MRSELGTDLGTFRTEVCGGVFVIRDLRFGMIDSLPCQAGFFRDSSLISTASFDMIRPMAIA